MKIEVRKPTEEEKSSLEKEPTWESPLATFPWHYPEKETCLILEGEVTVKTEGEEVTIREGDLAVFPEELSCTWEVTRPLRKHYRFG